LLVRREVFAEVGLLDERFFLYFEEVDFCKRAAQLGWECWCEPASRVVHLAGQATGVTDRSKRLRRPTYWFDSRRWYFLKHHGAAYTAIADLVWATAYAAWRCRRVVQRKVDTDPPRLLFDFLRHSVLARLSNVAPSPGQVST
jgi:GT2 family glycosyltransferase